MAKFRKGGSKEVPAISTGSMPDIIFMLIFFFMVTTQMRETENKVVVKLPEASQSVKLERKDLASYINIGTPTRQYQAQYGTDARIQLNDSFKTVDDIRDFIAAERDSMSEGAEPLLRPQDHVPGPPSCHGLRLCLHTIANRLTLPGQPVCYLWNVGRIS